MNEAKNSNEVWQADHVWLDILIIDDKEKTKRPWLTVIMDDCRRAIAGYELSFIAPSSMKTALCLRQGRSTRKRSEWDAPCVAVGPNVLLECE